MSDKATLALCWAAMSVLIALDWTFVVAALFIALMQAVEPDHMTTAPREG